MLENYAIIGIALVLAVIMGGALLLLGTLVRPKRPNPKKSQPYESGIPDVDPPDHRLTPRYYVVALLFVVFDVEVIFLLPWAVAFDALGLFGYIQAVIFISMLLFGFAYEWKKGGLEWV